MCSSFFMYILLRKKVVNDVELVSCDVYGTYLSKNSSNIYNGKSNRVMPSIMS